MRDLGLCCLVQSHVGHLCFVRSGAAVIMYLQSRKAIWDFQSWSLCISLVTRRPVRPGRVPPGTQKASRRARGAMQTMCRQLWLRTPWPQLKIEKKSVGLGPLFRQSSINLSIFIPFRQLCISLVKQAAQSAPKRRPDGFKRSDNRRPRGSPNHVLSAVAKDSLATAENYKKK